MVVRQATQAVKVPTTLVIQSRERTAVEVMTDGAPSPMNIAFSVSYKRLEYLSFVTSHLTATLIKNGKLCADKPLPMYARCLMTVVGSIVFFFKRRKMPVCHFEIDDIRICRSTALGLLTLPWTEVVAVHRYVPGLLVAKKSGALPLPFRCLTPSQIELLEHFVDAWQASHCQVAVATP